MITKICPHCKIEKPRDQFSKDKNRAGGIASWCRECCGIYQRARYKSDPAKNLASNRQWRKENPLNKLKNDLKKYGLSLEQFNNMREQQEYSCAICKVHESGLSNRLHVDHCHVTKKVRGLLCGNCNTALGLLKENIGIILNLVEYINAHTNLTVGVKVG